MPPAPILSTSRYAPMRSPARDSPLRKRATSPAVSCSFSGPTRGILRANDAESITGRLVARFHTAPRTPEHYLELDWQWWFYVSGLRAIGRARGTQAFRTESRLPAGRRSAAGDREARGGHQ